MTKKFAAVSAIICVAIVSGCSEEIKQPTCFDLKEYNIEMLKKQEEKFPELMRDLRDKCPNQSRGNGYEPSTATKGLIR